MSSSVLYDAPGPKARRNNLIGSIIGGAAILGLIALVLSKLNENGQLAPELWAPLLDPNNEVFPQVWALLREGFKNTLLAAAISIVLSLAIGIALGTARLSMHGVKRWPIVALIELVRGAPVVVAIYFAANVLPQFGIQLDNLWYLVIGLTAYNSVIFAEILRAGVASLPKGQREAGLAIGLTPLRTLQIVQLPQAFRVMLPAIISQIIVCLKDTTLAAVALAGFTEALNQSKAIYLNLDNPIQVYTVVGIIFITINFLLGKFAEWVERRMSTRTAGGHIDTTQVAGAGGKAAASAVAKV